MNGTVTVMSPNRISALLDLVIGGSGLALIFLYVAGILQIPFTLLLAAVSGLSAVGLGLPGVFPRHSRAPLPGPMSFSVVALLLATVAYFYSFFSGEDWIPLIVGGLFTFVGVTAIVVVAFRPRKGSAT